MDSTYVVVFSCVAGGVLLVSILSSGVLWARLSAVDERQEALAREVLKQVPPKQLEKALATSEACRDRIDNALLELSKFKDQVHGEIQRGYATMRRHEKTSGFEKSSPSTDDEPAPPDEISVDALKKPNEGATPPDESKADLRKRARAAGLM